MRQRKEMVLELVQYLLQTGDTTVMTEAYQMAVMALKSQLKATPNGIAAHFGCSERTVYRWMKRTCPLGRDRVEFILKCCKKPRTLAFLRHKLAEAGLSEDGFVDWLKLLIKLELLTQVGDTYVCAEKQDDVRQTNLFAAQ